jgi:hypothetical protein
MNMNRHKLLIIIVGTLLFLGCNSAHEKEAANFSDSLIVVSDAKDVHYTKVYGSDQLYFQITAEYPAKAVLDDISQKLQMKGWKPLPESYLNPSMPSSHIKGWQDFIDGTQSPERKVHQWLAQWENKNGDILFLTLRYSYPTHGKANLKALTVYQLLHPQSLLLRQERKVLKTHHRNEDH